MVARRNNRFFASDSAKPESPPPGAIVRVSADAAGGRTRIQVDSRIHYTPWIIRPLEPLATPAATKKLDQDFAALKRLIEKTATTAAN